MKATLLVTLLVSSIFCNDSKRTVFGILSIYAKQCLEGICEADHLKPLVKPLVKHLNQETANDARLASYE